MSAKRENAKRRKGRGVTKGIIKLFVFAVVVVLSYSYPLVPVRVLAYLCPLGYAGNSEGDFSSPAQKFTLDNGMVVIIKELPQEELVAIGGFLRAGSSNEGKFLGSGISHFTEHMLFKGTATRGVGEIEEEVKSYGGRINGFTSFDYTGYSLTVPAQYFDKSIELIGDFLINPSFDQGELEKEREVILREIDLNRDDPRRFLRRLLWSNAYSVHPYHYSVIGERGLFKRLTRNDLREYHRLMYVPRNLVIVVAGNVTAEKALSKIKSTFNNFPSYFSPYLSLPLPGEPRQMAAKRVVKESAVNTVYFNLAFRSVELANRDVYALDLLATILGRGESSQFNKILNYREKLVDTIAVFNYTPRYPGLFIISGTTEKGNLNRAMEAVFAEIGNVKKGSIGREELNRAKNQLKADYFFHQETLEAQTNDLALNEILVGDFDFSRKYIKGINAVGLKDIQRVAKQYLSKDNSTISILTPSSGTVDVEQKEKEVSRPKILKKTFDNGLTLLLKEEHNLPLVSIVVAFKGGLRAENEADNGISYLSAQSLSRAVKVKKGEEIFKSIEAMGGNIASFSGNNSFGLSLNLPSSALEEGLELLGGILINPRFSPGKIEREKEKMLAKLKREKDDVFSNGFRLLKVNLFKRHPYRFDPLGSEKSLAELTDKDVMNFYNKFIIPGNMVLSIFGDIDREEVLAKTENIFGRMKQREFKPLNVAQEPVLKAIVESSENINKEQTLIMLGFPAVSLYNEDRYTLELIGSVLSGAGGRLFKRIRDELGLAYTLGAFLVSGIDTGYYSFYVATTYDNLSKARKELFSEISRLKEELLGDGELKVARAGLIGRSMISLQGNAALAFRTSLDELYGLGFDNYTQYRERINRISAEDIKRAANKYFNLDAYAMVTLTQDKN